MRTSAVFRSLASGGLAAAILALQLAGCHADPSATSTAAGAGGGPISPSGTSLLLQVLDAAGTPLSTAVVTPASPAQSRLTDGAGYLLLEDLAPGRFSARVERVGYAPAVVAIDLPEGVHGGTEVHLLPLPAPLPFDAATGATLDAAQVHVTIPPGALLDRNGEPVSGPVEATVVPLDPSAGLTALPGPLEGQTAAGGNVVSLESFGMAEVTVWQNGLPLQLAPGKTASLEVVLPDALAQKTQPGATIPAWWLDLDAGVWREDGAGLVQPSLSEPGKLAWVAQVSHFTWWNADHPWTDKNCFIVTVKSDDELENVPGQPVIATGVSYIGVSSSKLTDAEGKACVEIMLGATATLSVGPSAAPFATAMVTGSGPAGDCAGQGAACTLIAPALAVPFGAVCSPGDHIDCNYNGPPATVGIGHCRAARRYCNGSGTAFLDCAGEVLPEPERCTTPDDDDCDGLVNEEGNDCLCNFGDTAFCYTGPVGTVDVGLCHGGTRSCRIDGQGFGLCEGEVVPATEDCSTLGIDEDCDGLAGCGGLAFWSKRFSGAIYQNARATAVDGAGNVLLTDYFQGTVDFGGGPLTSTGNTDIYVAKFDPAGNHLWSKRFGGADDQFVLAIAVDGAGNVLLTGALYGTVDFGGGPRISAGSADVFVAKLDPAGNHLWSKRFGDANVQQAYATSVDEAGNVLLAGEFAGTVNFGGGILTSAGNTDIFVAKLDPAGNHLWSKRFGGAIAPLAFATAVDGAGNVLLSGYFYGTLDFGGGTLTSAGDNDIFVAKLDPAGNHLWSKRFGDANNQLARTIAVDGAGNILLTGTFAGTVDFGGGTLTSAGDYDIFVTKLDPAGKHLWSKRFGDASSQEATATAVDGAGNVLLGGAFNGTVDFGGGPLSSAGSADVFVAKLNPAGKHLWSKRFGDASGQDATAAAMDGAGNVLLIGLFNGTVDFGNGPLTSAGKDLFLTKLSP